MPKPRRFRPDPTETIPLPEEEEDMKPHTLKKRAVTDPATPTTARSEPTTPEDSKKKSRFELIKSKLSFKDLRKESLKAEIVSPIPSVPDVPTLVSSEDAQSQARRPLAGSDTPAFSPRTYNFKAKLKPAEQGKSPTVSGITETPSQIPRKIPLPPSGTLFNVTGTVTPMRRISRRLARPVDQSAVHIESHGDKTDALEKLATETKRSTSAPSAKLQPNIVVARSSLEASRQSFRPSTPSCPSLEYPVTDDSPPKAADLLEGSGRVKYLPRHWVIKEDGTNSPPQQSEPSVPTAYKKGEPPVESLPDYMMSFKERLEKAKIPLDKPIPAGIQNRSFAGHVDDIADMIRSVQRHTENGIQNVNTKLDELSNWIGDRLKSEAESVSDLGRGNSELLAKQYEVSREMMKFKLDVRTEIGVMEQRLYNFEIKIIDEIQAQMRALTRSQEELTQRNEALEAQLLAQSEETQKYIEEMRRQTEEIEKEVEELQSKGVHPRFLEMEAKLAMIQHVFGKKNAQTTVKNGNERTNLNNQHPSPASTKIVIASEGHECQSAPVSDDTATAAMKTQKSPIALHLPVAGQPAPSQSGQPVLTQYRVTESPQPMSTSMFPRSMSLSKRGFLRNVKGAVGPTQGPADKDKKEQAPQQTLIEDTKKWNVFGFRRRRRTSDSAGSNNNKFNWPASRRGKETSTTNEPSSSRSSTPPVPPIPRMIHQTNDKPNLLSSSHQLVRSACKNKAQHENETRLAQTLPITAGLIQSHVPHEGSSTHDSIQTSTCTTSSLGENKLTTSSVISPDSFHSAHADPPAYTAVEDSAQAPLLGENDQEWDQVSLRESQSREPFA